MSNKNISATVNIKVLHCFTATIQFCKISSKHETFLRNTCTVYAIYFAYRYFRDFGQGGEICDGLIS